MRDRDKVDKIIKIDFEEIENRFSYYWHLQQLRANNKIPDHIPDEQIGKYVETKKGGEKIV